MHCIQLTAGAAFIWQRSGGLTDSGSGTTEQVLKTLKRTCTRRPPQDCSQGCGLPRATTLSAIFTVLTLVAPYS
jgi:hypothetical protein